MSWLFNRRKKTPRVLVLGLDCASPDLIFHQCNADLPNLRQLMNGGTWGKLQSSIPCITVPAWASMLSSRDPGVLGVYGFRNRTDYSYESMGTADARAVKVKRVWDYLSEAGKQSVILNVPQTYPPRPLNGHVASCFLTPGLESAFAYPAIFKQEILNLLPDYKFDVKGFRTEDKAWLLQQLIDLSEVQYKLVKHCLTSKPWDFFMHVNIGVDRIHHGFWRFHDPQHRLYQPGNSFENAIREYYKMVDRFIGEILQIVSDDITVLVVSDHGVKRMDGGICINEWLWREGWLTLKTSPVQGQLTTFDEAEIDWSQTKAWGAGGYYGRISLNVQGREAHGTIPPENYEQVRNELAAAISTIPGPDGKPLNTTVYKPQEIYTQLQGIPPDLLVYFGDLHWRSVGSFGHGTHYTLENDTGPDDANHDVYGMFILHEPGQRGAGCVEGHQLMDVAPTLLNRMGLPVPAEMQGKMIGA
jgi:predicted AlkP superfamily phosphohydrolase/phosphomutase